MKTIEYTLKRNAPTEEFSHSWEGLVNIDQFRWMLREDVRKQLKTAHVELGAKNVRAVGMFDDELKAYCIDPKDFTVKEGKKCRSNFRNIDNVTDFLTANGINPMITTTFVPSVMAGGEHTVFETKSRTDMPSDMDWWSDFISEYVEHITQRYGAEKVEEFYFEVWNEPNLKPFFPGEYKDFLKLWEVTYKAIKKVNKKYRVGGPSTAGSEWIEEFINDTRKINCEPDYLITHIYNKDGENECLSPFEGAQVEKNNKSPHWAASKMKNLYSLVKKLNFKGEIHWNEWGRSWWVSDFDRETPNEAAYIVKTMCEVSQFADYYAYWCLSDIYDQEGFGKEVFHGNYGLLSADGLKKPAYYAFELLCRTGQKRIKAISNNEDMCKGALFTTSDKGEAAILYNYCDGIEEDIEVVFDLPKEYKDIKIYRVDKNNNNIIEKWHDAGSPDYLSLEQLKEFEKINHLTASDENINIDNGKIKIRMNGAGVVFVETNIEEKEC